MKHLALTLIVIGCFTLPAAAEDINLDAIQDTDIWSVDPDGNTGDWSWFDLRGGTGTEERARALIQFDVEALDGMIIDVATLRLFSLSSPWYLENGHAEIYRAADAWDEATVTWNNQPAENKEIRLVEVLPPPSDVWAELNVTEIVQSWADGFENHGFFLGIPDGTPEGFVGYASKDTSDAAIRPVLSVTYRTGAVAEQPSGELSFQVTPVSSRKIEICFSLPSTNPAAISIFTASGTRLETLECGGTSGIHQLTWDADHAGVFFIRLEADGLRMTRKAIVLN